MKTESGFWFVIKQLSLLFWTPLMYVLILFLAVLFFRGVYSFGIWDIEPFLNTFQYLAWTRWTYITFFFFNLWLSLDELIP